MSAKARRTKTAERQAVDPTTIRHSSFVIRHSSCRWQLITSSILLTLWILFLAWIALAG